MDSRARAGPHGAPCWRLMVGAYARDARAYFATPWASWTRALRSALPHPLDRPLRPQTGNSPLLSPPAAAASRASRAPSPRVGRRARRVDGQDWCCCAPSARHTRWRWPCPPWPRASCTPPTQQQRPHCPPPHPTPQSQGADGRHQAQADPAHGGRSVPGDPGATSVALVVWLSRRPSCFATFYTPIYRLSVRMNIG